MLCATVAHVVFILLVGDQLVPDVKDMQARLFVLTSLVSAAVQDITPIHLFDRHFHQPQLRSLLLGSVFCTVDVALG